MKFYRYYKDEKRTCKHLYANVFHNLDKMNTFLEKHSIKTYTSRKTNLKNPVCKS